MPSKPGATAHAKASDTTAAVDAYMAGLDHPLKADLERVRRLVLGVDPGIHEGIKWNAPSFRTTEYFATANLRGGAGVRIILHLGAKARDLPPDGLRIEDPDHLLTWLDAGRAMVEFKGPGEVDANAAALSSILRQWIGYV